MGKNIFVHRLDVTKVPFRIWGSKHRFRSLLAWFLCSLLSPKDFASPSPPPKKEEKWTVQGKRKPLGERWLMPIESGTKSKWHLRMELGYSLEHSVDRKSPVLLCVSTCCCSFLARLKPTKRTDRVSNGTKCSTGAASSWRLVRVVVPRSVEDPNGPTMQSILG